MGKLRWTGGLASGALSPYCAKCNSRVPCVIRYGSIITTLLKRVNFDHRQVYKCGAVINTTVRPRPWLYFLPLLLFAVRRRPSVIVAMDVVADAGKMSSGQKEKLLFRMWTLNLWGRARPSGVKAPKSGHDFGLLRSRTGLSPRATRDACIFIVILNLCLLFRMLLFLFCHFACVVTLLCLK